MSLALTVRAMAAAGCTTEQITAVAAAYEAEAEKKIATKRAKGAVRQQSYRARNASDALLALRDARNARNASDALPPPKKERVPPTPPLQEKTTPPLIVADATIVDEPVDASIAFEKAKKNNEALKAFGEEWNRLAAALALPSIDEIKPGSTRERQALARLREMTPDGVQGLMTRIRGSPYLRGEVNSFRVSFDWIIKPSNYQKIMEGNYDEIRKVTPFRR